MRRVIADVIPLLEERKSNLQPDKHAQQTS